MADQKKTYTVTTATTPARPRSKARRDGMGLTSGGASAIIESATAGNAQRASHANTADEAAHALRADEAAQAATAKTAEHATTADRATAATRADEATHAATATNATTADHANTADTATRAQSAQTADHAATAARAEQAQRATESETLRTPNYSDGLTTGAGARIDAMGNAEFQSMAVRGFFRAAEYQINRIALSEGDVFHTENGLVKSAEQQADGRWKVVLQERFQGDVTGFRAGDILRGAYNSVGTSGGSAEIRTSWLRVEAVDAQAGTLTASLYADNQTPEGRNAPPVSLMRLARWGNTTDPERQSHIVESATDGRIVRRVKVTAPIVDGAQSDGFVVGKLPAWLREHFGAAVADASDYVFARGIITQNILRYTPAGRPLAERVDRGLWSASSRYFYEEQNPETGAFEISRVWHDGALYELARGGNGDTAPAAQSTHWTLIQAKPKDGDAGKSAPPTGTNLIDGTSFRNMEEVRRWKYFERFTFDPSQTDRVHPLAQAVCAHRDGSWLQGLLYVASLLRPNATYTLSVYSKGAPGVLVFWGLSASTNRDTRCTNADTDKWTRYSYTFTTPDTIPNGVVIALRCLDHNAKTYFSALKLEEGETATPWCLSEMDKKGEKGDSGRGIDRIETFYLLTPDGTAPGYDARDWGNTAPVPTLQKPWLWTYERVVYSDGTSVRTPVRLDTRLAKDGADAEPMRPNLLDDTDFQQLGRKESAWKIGIYGVEPIAGRANISIFSSAVDGCVPAICAINPGTKEGEFAHIYQNVGQLIPGRTYTFSVYVRGADVAWLIVYPTPAEHFHPNTVKQDGWTRVSLSFRAPAVQDPDGVLLLLRAWHRETTPHTGYAKNVVWCAPKLEEGNRATQWCPSFRDQRGADGSPGVRGAAVRQLGDYDRLPDGTTFESGHAGETYLDVVQVRQGEQVQFYQCKQPHTKSADKAPAADSEWWELGMYQGFIATDLLLAERSLIKNLQVENVFGHDANGNTTFDLDASTGTAYFGGTATFAGFIRRRPVVITPDNWEDYGGVVKGGVIYLNPFRVGTYVVFRGNFGELTPTIDTGSRPLNDGAPLVTKDNSFAMRYYGAQFMVFNDLEPRPDTYLYVGGLKIRSKQTAIFTMKGHSKADLNLWWRGELVESW